MISSSHDTYPTLSAIDQTPQVRITRTLSCISCLSARTTGITSLLLNRPREASWALTEALLSHRPRAVRRQGPTFGLTLCRHHCIILTFWKRGPYSHSAWDSANQGTHPAQIWFLFLKNGTELCRKKNFFCLFFKQCTFLLTGFYSTFKNKDVNIFLLPNPIKVKHSSILALGHCKKFLNSFFLSFPDPFLPATSLSLRSRSSCLTRAWSCHSAANPSVASRPEACTWPQGPEPQPLTTAWPHPTPCFWGLYSTSSMFHQRR